MNDLNEVIEKEDTTIHKDQDDTQLLKPYPKIPPTEKRDKISPNKDNQNLIQDLVVKNLGKRVSKPSRECCSTTYKPSLSLSCI